MNAGLQYRVEQFLYRHAELCDAQDWDGYLRSSTNSASSTCRSGSPSSATPAIRSARCR